MKRLLAGLLSLSVVLLLLAGCSGGELDSTGESSTAPELSLSGSETGSMETGESGFDTQAPSGSGAVTAATVPGAVQDKGSAAQSKEEQEKESLREEIDKLIGGLKENG